MECVFYTDKYSYDLGEEIKIFLFNQDENINIKIHNINKDIIYNTKLKLALTELNNYRYKILFKKKNIPFYNGYDFKNNIAIDTNKITNFKKGLYFIEINNFYRPLIILNKDRNNENLILMNTNTWEAYNQDGGASFYRYNLKFDTNGIAKYDANKNKNKPYYGKVNFYRSNTILSNEIRTYLTEGIKNYKSHLIYGELYLLTFLTSKNIDFDLFCDRDSHNNYPVWNYTRVILNTHPEYWSLSQLNNIKKCSNILSFAGNVGYRIIEYNNNQNIIINHRSRKGIVDPNILKDITGCIFTVEGGSENKKFRIIDNRHPIFKGIATNDFGSLEMNFKDIQTGINKYLEGTSGWETDKQIDRNYGQIIGIGENKPKGAHVLVYNDSRLLISFNSILFCHGIYFDGGNTKQIILNCLDMKKK